MRRQNARGAMEQANAMSLMATRPRASFAAAKGTFRLPNRSKRANNARAAGNAELTFYVFIAPEPDGNTLQQKDKFAQNLISFNQ